MISRQAQFRRYIFRPFIIIIFIYIVARLHYYYYGKHFNGFFSSKSAPVFNTYIDKKGNFLPYSGYKILQHVVNPLADTFDSLYSHLDQQNELKLYFKLVPKIDYHVTLTDLDDDTPYKEKDIQRLEQEQRLLDANDTLTTCSGKQLFIVEKYEIRLRVELKDDYVNNIKELQQRWKEKFPALIAEHYTTFHITLAYQYNNIPNKEILDKLTGVLNEWQQFPFDIDLDPIEICLFTTRITYTPIIPDPVDAA